MKFIGGYYIDEMETEVKGLAYTEVIVMDLEDAEKHPAIENYKDSVFAEDIDIEDATEEEKFYIIEKYIEGDEIFGGAFYGDEDVEDKVEELKKNKEAYEIEDQNI